MAGLTGLSAAPSGYSIASLGVYLKKLFTSLLTIIVLADCILDLVEKLLCEARLRRIENVIKGITRFARDRRYR